MCDTVDHVHDSDAAVPLGRSIGRTHKFLRAWVDEELAPLDTSVTEYIVLFHIDGAAAPGASQIEIARFSDMGGPALVRHIDRLEADGIVERSRDRTDRRVIRLTLTAAGRRRLADLQAVISRCDAEMRAVVSADDAAVMQRSLDALFAHALARRSETAGAGNIEPDATTRRTR